MILQKDGKQTHPIYHCLRAKLYSHGVEGETLGSQAWKYKQELKENASIELSGLHWEEYSR